MGYSFVEIILTKDLRVRSHWQRVKADVLGNWRSKDNGSVIDQILDLILDCCCRSLGCLCDNYIRRFDRSFSMRGHHRLGLDSGNEASFQSF